jgi:hypothetical protein
MIIVNLCKDIEHDYKKWWGQWKAMPTCINEYRKFVGIWIFAANVGKIKAITMKDWNLAMEELCVPWISQCLCL